MSAARVDPDEPLSQERAWALLLAVARRAGSGSTIERDTSLRLHDDGSLESLEWREQDTGAASIVARPAHANGWSPVDGRPPTPDAARLLDVYMPLCIGARSSALTIAHLAQTLDGRVAIASGESQFITGDEDLVHSHRLRALCDVVVVGRCTVEHDDPQLTTRRCDGPSPVRVVIDPDRRLGEAYRLFQPSDVTTLLFCKESSKASAGAGTRARHGAAEVVALGAQTDGTLPVAAVIEELRRRGLRRIYIEGGGVTVSRFLEAGVLTRLHVTVAPTVFGSGRPSFVLPPIATLAEARKLTARTFALGPDVLFDCATGDAGPPASRARSTPDCATGDAGAR